MSNEERARLFEACAAVVYTPSHEHFGIVPLEAMAAARPVLKPSIAFKTLSPGLDRSAYRALYARASLLRNCLHTNGG